MRWRRGAVLYTIDSSDAESSLEQAQISLDQAQRNYDSMLEERDDLTVRSTIAGQVISLEVEVGDEVTAGETIATVRDSDTMTLTVHFPTDDADGFYVGQSASVTLDSTFETLSGTVSEISSVETVLTGTSDDSYIEIVSGLQEGDVVAYIPISSSDSDTGFAMGGGMSGGGGGMPGGGGGGMPGGGF